MFEKLKRKSLRKIIEKNLEDRDLSKVNSEVKTLGFVVDQLVFQDFDRLYDFYELLDLLPKDVKVFSFIEVKKKLPSLLQNQVQSKDFDWKGVMHNQNATEFLDREFDVLVGFYDHKHDFLDAMVSQSKAKFKVGFVDADARLFDLIIGLKTAELDAFKVEFKKYLQVLGKIK